MKIFWGKGDFLKGKADFDTDSDITRLGPLVKGGWIFLTDRAEKDWGIPFLESPRHFVALSPLTRGVKAGRGLRLPQALRAFAMTVLF